MKTPVQSEIEHLALTAELARQVGHDFGNFIYSVFLQIEIAETAGNASPGWSRIKEDGKAMSRLLQELQRFRDRVVPHEAQIDLNELVRQVVSDLPFQGAAPTLALSAHPLPITTTPSAARHLVRLAIEDLLQSWQEALGTRPRLTMETARAAKATVHIVAAEPKSFPLPPALLEEPKIPSLLRATCQALAMRMDATLRHESTDTGSLIARIEFP